METIKRTFIWFGCNAEGLQDFGRIEGETLLEAIINEYQKYSNCIYWDNYWCEDFALLPIKEKARKILWMIEQSFVEGTSANEISVIDITNQNAPIIVFPINQRSKDFDSRVIGIKYYIKAWIPAECENPEIYDSVESVEGEIESLRLMQPENRYEVVEVEDDDSNE